jgi:hypothetical protein
MVRDRYAGWTLVQFQCLSLSEEFNSNIDHGFGQCFLEKLLEGNHLTGADLCGFAGQCKASLRVMS